MGKSKVRAATNERVKRANMIEHGARHQNPTPSVENLKNLRTKIEEFPQNTTLDDDGTSASTDDVSNDDYVFYPLPYSTCYEPTNSTYYVYVANNITTITPAFCASYSQPVPLPPMCITNMSQYVYAQGSFSIDQTFYNCLANVLDSASLPTFYNGRYNGCLLITTSITLLNLVRVSKAILTVGRLQTKLCFV
jgi:hypothetical protein